MDAGERQCPVCSAIFATDAALGSHLAVCVGRARAEAKRPPPRTEAAWTMRAAACSATSAASAC